MLLLLLLLLPWINDLRMPEMSSAAATS